jgi:hypothetical protein
MGWGKIMKAPRMADQANPMPFSFTNLTQGSSHAKNDIHQSAHY